MMFHTPNKKVKTINIKIMNIQIECVDHFNLLGINLDKNLSWKYHIDTISNKISRSIGLLSRLKFTLPLHIKLMIYNSLILSYINYGILNWGFHCERINKLQKKAVRIITNSKYNAHAEPLLKKLNLLNVNDIFNICQLKFFHKYTNSKLPKYFQNIPFVPRNELHNYNTRDNHMLHIHVKKHNFAQKCIRQSIPKLLSSTPFRIKQKLHTHSLTGFSNYVKQFYISKYLNGCTLRSCYICNRN